MGTAIIPFTGPVRTLNIRIKNPGIIRGHGKYRSESVSPVQDFNDDGDYIWELLLMTESSIIT